MKEVKWVKLNDQHQQQQHPNGHFSPLKLGKLLDPEAFWEKDQLGDVLHWIRQVVALACGLLCGAIPWVGGIWILLLTKKNSVVMEPFSKRGFLLPLLSSAVMDSSIQHGSLLIDLVHKSGCPLVSLQQ